MASHNFSNRPRIRRSTGGGCHNGSNFAEVIRTKNSRSYDRQRLCVSPQAKSRALARDLYFRAENY